MARFARRNRKLAQNGVQAIFSGKATQRSGENISESYLVESRFDPSFSGNGSSISPTREVHDKSGLRVSRVVIAIVLIGLGMTMIAGVMFVDSGSQHTESSGNRDSGSGPSPSPPIKSVRRIAPSLYAVSTIPEGVVSRNSSFSGSITTGNGDFLVLQIAYSQGSAGKLPDISDVRDSMSLVYNRVASATPGVGSNFWEQVWAGKGSLATTLTNVTMTPDWTNCAVPCVDSIIVAMTIARYRDVDAVGDTATVAPSASSNSQTASIPVSESSSVLVELLSHGASSNCVADAALPKSGQTSRNCFTGTTEKTELFDHSIINAQTCTESFAWAQLEVQRGIYVELIGSPTL